MSENLTEKEPGREYKVRQYRRHMVGFRNANKVMGALSTTEAWDENITADLVNRKDLHEEAARILRGDLNIKTPERFKI